MWDGVCYEVLLLLTGIPQGASFLVRSITTYITLGTLPAHQVLSNEMDEVGKTTGDKLVTGWWTNLAQIHLSVVNCLPVHSLEPFVLLYCPRPPLHAPCVHVNQSESAAGRTRRRMQFYNQFRCVYCASQVWRSDPPGILETQGNRYRRKTDLSVVNNENESECR